MNSRGSGSDSTGYFTSIFGSKTAAALFDTTRLARRVSELRDHLFALAQEQQRERQVEYLYIPTERDNDKNKRK